MFYFTCNHGITVKQKCFQLSVFVTFLWVLSYVAPCMETRYFLLRRVALVAQRPIVVKLSRERSVGRSLCLSSALWKNGGSDPYVVWHHRSDGFRDETNSGVWGSVYGKWYFGANLGCAIVTNRDFTAYVCDSAATRPSSQITLGRLVCIKLLSPSTFYS